MKTSKINTIENWDFQDKIRRIIDKNCTEVPYEGTEVDKQGIVDDIAQLLSSPQYSVLKHIKTK